MSTSRDIRDLLEAPASSGHDAFLISKTIFTKIGAGSTAEPCCVPALEGATRRSIYFSELGAQ